MKKLYLVLAILGAIVPYVFFLQYFAEVGFAAVALIAAAFANNSAAGFTVDLFFSSCVFWLYMFKREEGPSPWLFVVLNLTVGLSCALPAYLYAAETSRERLER
jgi:hypothetical protein